MPTVSQTSLRPWPARWAASGVVRPALARAIWEHPVCTTRMSFLISSLTSSTWTQSCFTRGLVQPTTPATPRMRPLMMLSFNGV